MRSQSALVLIPGLAMLVVTAVNADIARAGDVVAVGRRWPAGEQISADAVDHTIWDRLLKKYVDRRGDVDYATWKATAQDAQLLDTYLAMLSQSNPRTKSSRAGQFAYWINAYNAVTIRGILREYPTSSIRNHTARFVGYNIWDDLKLVTPAGDYSLNQMEHSILRKMNDYRIHFAIVCASKGCPRLLNEAYTAAKLNDQLTMNTRAFFADPRKFRFEAGTNTLHVSPILEWFAEDFGAGKVQQMKTIAPYLPDAVSHRAAAGGSANVAYLDYDWNLNAQNRRTAGRPGL